MKRLVRIMIVMILLSSLPVVGFAASDDISVYLDGEALAFEVPPQRVGDRVMVPLRDIFEALGLIIEWDDETRTVTGIKEGVQIVLGIDQKIAYVNGQEIELDVAPLIIQNRTFVPVRFISESTGAAVVWDQASFSVFIASMVQEEPQTPAVPEDPSEILSWSVVNGPGYTYIIMTGYLHSLNQDTGQVLQLNDTLRIQELLLYQDKLYAIGKLENAAEFGVYELDLEGKVLGQPLISDSSPLSALRIKDHVIYVIQDATGEVLSYSL